MIAKAASLPKISGAFWAIVKPRQIKRRKIKIIKVLPTRPTSSATTAKIESTAASGRYWYFCLDCPRPRPKIPPEPIAIKACLIC